MGDFLTVSPLSPEASRLSEISVQCAERVGYNSDYPASDFDLVFGNVLIRPRPGKDGGLEGFLEGEWTLIDYEWTFGKPMDTRRLAFRAAYWYLLEDERRNKIGLDWILRECAMTEKDVKEFWEEEGEFQRFVTGNRCSMTGASACAGAPPPR